MDGLDDEGSDGFEGLEGREEFDGADEGPATGAFELEGFELDGRFRGRSVRVDGGGFFDEPLTFGDDAGEVELCGAVPSLDEPPPF